MSQKLYTTNVGTIIFEAELPSGTMNYICSSLSLTMQLNALPTATVVIGCGESILTGHDNDYMHGAEDILVEVTKSAGHNTNFINCAIYEQNDSGRVCIFKGCIIAASLVYKTGNVTMRAVRLECMNAACKLYCQPFSAYSNRCAADIINKILVGAVIQNGKESAQSYGMEISALTEDKLSSELIYALANKDIATKIAYITDAIALLTTRVVNTTEPLKEADLGDILKVGTYLKSECWLNYKELDLANHQTDNEFNKRLCAQMLGMVKSGSIWDAIVSILTSPEYMLTLVPSWSDKDFVMQIKPSNAWNTTKNWTIGFGMLADMNSSFTPLSHINDPEVFVTDFSPALEFGAPTGVVGDPSSSLVGAYSTDPKMMEWINLRFSDSSIEFPKRMEIAKNMMRYKWKEYAAPAWLRNSLIRMYGDEKKTLNELQEEAVINQRTWDKENNVGNEEKPVVKDYNVAKKIADMVAKSLYVHIHGASATAQVSLLPNARFGMKNNFALEQHIGEIINILPDKKDSRDHLAIRGMLEGLQFEYNAGMSANCRYTMLLSRVRPYDESEPSLTCPLYASEFNGTDWINIMKQAAELLTAAAKSILK